MDNIDRKSEKHQKILQQLAVDNNNEINEYPISERLVKEVLEEIEESRRKEKEQKIAQELRKCNALIQQIYEYKAKQAELEFQSKRLYALFALGIVVSVIAAITIKTKKNRLNKITNKSTKPRDNKDIPANAILVH